MKEYDHYRVIDERNGQSCGTFKYKKGFELPEAVIEREMAKAREKKNAPVDVLTIQRYIPYKKFRRQ